jgi:hypothetical protein
MKIRAFEADHIPYEPPGMTEIDIPIQDPETGECSSVHITTYDPNPITVYAWARMMQETGGFPIVGESMEGEWLTVQQVPIRLHLLVPRSAYN